MDTVLISAWVLALAILSAVYSLISGSIWVLLGAALVLGIWAYVFQPISVIKYRHIPGDKQAIGCHK
jgi:hypothetical protein